VCAAEASPPDVQAWSPWHPRDAVALLADCPVPWFVAGGWAVDLHIGRPTRTHSDLEIAIVRPDLPRLRPYLSSYDLYGVGNGLIYPLGPDGEPKPEDHQVWVCEPAVPAWRMDIFLEPGDHLTWVSHRDDRIRVPYAQAVARTGDGVPYLRPELVLLAKAKHVRDKDETDLQTLLPTLTSDAQRWLADSLGLIHPGHRWVDRLAGTSG
jgi:hypothetical protein